jgi:type VI protein secretion system component VasK
MFDAKKIPENQQATITSIIQKLSLQIAKKGNSKNKIVPDSRPWYILLGTESGKTTSLLESCFEPAAGNTQTIKCKSRSHILEAWLDNEKIILEFPSNRLFGDLDDLQELERAIDKVRGTPLDGIIIMLKADDLYDSNIEFQNTCNKISQALFTLKSSKTTPVHIIINQCNSIPGFSETFSEQTAKNNLLQIPINSRSNITDKARNKTFAFNKSLQDFCTLQISETNDDNKIENIILARMHLEEASRKICDLIEKINWCDNLSLCNISFCSAFNTKTMQHDLAEEIIAPIEYNPLIETNHKPAQKFVKSIYRQLNASSYSNTRTSIIKRYKPVLYILSTGALALAISLPIANYYNKQNTAIKIITNILSSSDQTGLATTISSLQQAKNIAMQYYGKKYQNGKLYKLVNQKLNSTISNSFKNNLLGVVRDTLIKQTNNKSSNLYSTLKLYLMLHGKGELDNLFIKNWFQYQWSLTGKWDQQTQASMLATLDTALRSNLLSKQTSDMGLVDAARNSLDKLTLTQLSYNILTNSIPPGYLNLNNAVPSDPSVNLQIHNVPTIYTIENSGRMLGEIIPNIMLLINRNDWVIQKNIAKKINKKTLPNFIAEIKHLYLSAYSAQWAQVLNSITVTSAESMQQTQNRISQLTQSYSKLWGILNIILHNTHSSDKSSDFYNIITSSFLTLDSINPTNNNKLVVSLNQLSSFLNSISNAKDPQATALVIMQSITTNKDSIALINAPISDAAMQPEIIQSWVKSIVTSTKHNLFNAALGHTNQVWHNTILPFWASEIDNRYPIQKDAKDSVNTADFNKFFAPAGMLDQFIKTNIAPLVNTAQTLALNDTTTPITNNLQKIIMQTKTIQDVFFKNATTNTHATIYLAQNPSQGKQVIWHDGNHAIKLDSNRRQIKISLATMEEQKLSITDKSSKEATIIVQSNQPWSLLRMISGTMMTAGKTAGHFIASIQHNNDSVKLHINFDKYTTRSPLKILNDFNLPKSLNDADKK